MPVEHPQDAQGPHRGLELVGGGVHGDAAGPARLVALRGLAKHSALGHGHRCGGGVDDEWWGKALLQLRVVAQGHHWKTQGVFRSSPDPGARAQPPLRQVEKLHGGGFLLRALGGRGPKSHLESQELSSNMAGEQQGVNWEWDQALMRKGSKSVTCCPLTLQPSPTTSSPRGPCLCWAPSLLSILLFPHSPRGFLLLCPCRDAPNTQTLCPAARTHAQMPSHLPSQLALQPHSTSLLWARINASSPGGLSPSRAHSFCSRAGFLQQGRVSRGCYSQAGFDKFFFSPASSSRLRGKRSPSESDLEASPWSKAESFSREDGGLHRTDTPPTNGFPLPTTHLRIHRVLHHDATPPFTK